MECGDILAVIMLVGSDLHPRGKAGVVELLHHDGEGGFFV